MNRRGFLGVLTRGTVLGAISVMSAARVIEPEPSDFDLEECGSCACDLSSSSLDAALGVLHWDSRDAITALLCVSSASHGWALRTAERLCATRQGAIAVWATPHILDADTWFVAWHGRRVGSRGA